jgi:hypothetical protein
MKTFKDILSESKKTYAFKVGIAGELPEGFSTKLKVMLEKFSLATLSAGKKTPIQERPLDFPNLKNTEVHYFDVEVNYPTTPQVLGEYISQNCSVMPGHVLVRTPGDNLEKYQNEKEETIYEPLLTKTDLGGESAQQSVGGSRVMELLKELEIARKERDHLPSLTAPEGKSQKSDGKENTKSTIGS